VPRAPAPSTSIVTVRKLAGYGGLGFTPARVDGVEARAFPPPLIIDAHEAGPEHLRSSEYTSLLFAPEHQSLGGLVTECRSAEKGANRRSVAEPALAESGREGQVDLLQSPIALVGRSKTGVWRIQVGPDEQIGKATVVDGVREVEPLRVEDAAACEKRPQSVAALRRPCP